ncbi:putative repeat protein (TIGR01451 family) [Kribbella sp. VKM Ac-2571]|uniref:DUF11 domain-containing protein n=1 Tax=Kribbella sp. VKM Ac-2571 TaxID=2512222 RepID=UPI00105FB120|nr:DUF11 domain-containing protein [Kribbella sp. VKM Ac-2571]TDO52843.1 putative repeat protein (TIGR01451 family) [Kribbella sp. VKM Ac-2571]
MRSVRGAVAGIGSAVLVAGLVMAPGGAAGSAVVDDTPVLAPGAAPPRISEEDEQIQLQRDLFFMSRRTAGDQQLDNQQAGAQRAAAARAAAQLRKNGAPSPGPATFPGSWTGLGPDPIVQVTRSTPIFTAMAGRIGALAIRPSNGRFILGGAQGGIWLYDPATGTWSAKTDNQPSLAIGALAVAPSNDAIVYAGTGEGALSGDSYFGNGIMKSTDGGEHWAHVSGDFFEGVSTSALVVDPGNASHLYAAILRGRGGARRTTPPVHSRYGVWESKDGGSSWTLLKEAKSELNGATDLEIDPQNPKVLYSSFWGDAIYKSTDAGAHWSPIMTGLPAADYAGTGTRFSLGLSHPAEQNAVLYAGFNWNDQPARVFKSTNDGASWSILPAGTGADTVEDYCAEQCSYDNVILADPVNPNVVYAGGQFNYAIGSGGIFRSDDGGQTWKNLGWDQHPDFHAVAVDPANPDHVLIGNDGGVWYSHDRGGRPNATDPLNAVTWQNLNGTVDPNTAAVTHRTGLQLGQFTSIANVPTVPARVWGGTQDNGTDRKSTASNTWFDVASGDGGQVLVDPNDANFVFGTYFGITPYRYTDGGASFFSNQYIRTGINLNDRAEFYVPWVQNQRRTDQLFLGTYRLYRTDNGKAPSAGDVRWKPISPDLSSGCTGTAPNGGRGCFISAIGVGGGDAVYTGAEDGYVYVSPNAQVSDTPTWNRVDTGKLPKRPVTQFAVDPSNYRIAYAAYAGFNRATPSRPGHVFKTTDAGATWTDISFNLPDSPVNSVILDPSYANTLYAGTDVGPFVTHDGGVHWAPLGSGFPDVAIWQLNLDPSHRVLAAGTHGRGAYRSFDTSAVPALVVSKVDSGTPVGPGSRLEYAITVKNIGNAPATGVKVTDPVPANTTFLDADNGGTNVGGVATWNGLTIPAGGSITVHLGVRITNSKKLTAIVNDGVRVVSAEGPFTTGSPVTTSIAPAYAVSVSPATQTDGGRPATIVSYPLSVKNLGYTTDSYTLSSSGGTFPVAFFDSTCTTPATTTPAVAPGATAAVCAKVTVGASGSSTATVTATSVGSPGVSGSASIKTIAVTVDTLLVDNDGNAPDVQGAYATALTSKGVAFDTWDLSTDINLPQNYLLAHKNVVWFTGNTYPAPITPYEARLQAFLDNGGRLLMSGQDILDQAAGTTTFVRDYLHITWDGSETQNDKATGAVHGVAGNPVTNGIGTVPLDHSVLGATFEDRVTPNGGATSAFTDDAAQPDALTFSGTYKVVFLAFPLEAYGTAADKAELIGRTMTFFGP